MTRGCSPPESGKVPALQGSVSQLDQPVGLPTRSVHTGSGAVCGGRCWAGERVQGGAQHRGPLCVQAAADESHPVRAAAEGDFPAADASVIQRRPVRVQGGDQTAGDPAQVAASTSRACPARNASARSLETSMYSPAPAALRIVSQTAPAPAPPRSRRPPTPPPSPAERRLDRRPRRAGPLQQFLCRRPHVQARLTRRNVAAAAATGPLSPGPRSVASRGRRLGRPAAATPRTTASRRLQHLDQVEQLAVTAPPQAAPGQPVDRGGQAADRIPHRSSPGDRSH